MRRSTRYKMVREQQLARTAVAAGAAFGWADAAQPATELNSRRQMATILAPLLALAPVMTSVVWYWRS